MMNKKNIFYVMGLLLLAACECEVSKQGGEVAIVEDASLESLSADFIANAGDRVFFDFDKSSICAEAEQTLIKQVEWLKAHPDMNVLIEGHCDERGTREYNLGLGERRAEAVAKYLTEHGIEGNRVRTISYGKDRPIAAAGTQKEIYRLNRVSISVVEKNQ